MDEKTDLIKFAEFTKEVSWHCFNIAVNVLFYMEKLSSLLRMTDLFVILIVVVLD